MTKTLAFIIAALLLNGCSGAIKDKSAQAQAVGSIEDLTQSKYKASGSLEAESAEAKLVSCDDHTKPDPRLTEGTIVTETKMSAKFGEGLLTTNGAFEVKKNDDGVLSWRKTFVRAGVSYVRNENCSDSEHGYQCVFEKMEGKPFSAGNYCNFVADKDTKPVVSYEGGELTKENAAGLKTFVTVTSKQQGMINCHGKDQAPGSSVSKIVYSKDVPSVEKDSCSYGEVYRNYKILNADGSTREAHSREITWINYRLII